MELLVFLLCGWAFFTWHEREAPTQDRWAGGMHRKCGVNGRPSTPRPMWPTPSPPKADWEGSAWDGRLAKDDTPIFEVEPGHKIWTGAANGVITHTYSLAN